MPACADCGDFNDVRLFEVDSGDGQVTKKWSCWACAWERRQQGLATVPVWIERAARRQLPVKDLRLMSRDRRGGQRRQTDRRAASAN